MLDLFGNGPVPQVAPTPTATSSAISGPQHDVPETVDPLLVEVLSYPRKHDSVTEAEFQTWLKGRLELAGHKPSLMQLGSFSVEVKRPDGKRSTALFSCHTDTVDMPCAAGQRKTMNYDPNFGLITLANDSVGGCLGADDGAGVWIMLKMIEAKVPGTYIFHRAEECGGLSAKANADKEAKFLKHFEISVAFDRPRDNEIITHQGGLKCASDKFSKALCERLNSKGMDYKPSTNGVYTDNKEYRKLIAENVNVGVGYTGQHGRGEDLDYAHLNALLNACTAIDWDALPVDRNPAEADPTSAYKPYFKQPKAKDSKATNSAKWTSGYFEDDGRSPHWPESYYGDYDDYSYAPKANGKKVKRLFEPTNLTGMDVYSIADHMMSDPEDAAAYVIELQRKVARLQADVAFLEGIAGVGG